MKNNEQKKIRKSKEFPITIYRHLDSQQIKKRFYFYENGKEERCNNGWFM